VQSNNGQIPFHIESKQYPNGIEKRVLIMDKTNICIIKEEIGKNLEDNFSPFIQNVIRCHELPGLAIGIVADNEIVYARGFGVKSIETQKPISITTIFHMASISKPFVATGIVQLVERGQVQLDAPIITYLPYFKLDDERYGEITIQQMLNHVSGMPDVEDYEWEKPQFDEGALERYVRSLSTRKLLSKPGEKYAYSNMAFECLGDVIAKVSEMSFDDYVKEHILNPAGMTESSFLKPGHLPGNWAAPHVRLLANLAWEGYPYNRMHGPSSTLHSSALEMCNWAITNLNRGHFQGRQILRPSSYDMLWKPQAETGEGEHVGLSWFLAEYRGEKVIEHGGGDTGFRTHFAMLPDKRSAVVVLCNLIPAPAHKIAYSALDILLGYNPEPIIPYASILVLKTLKEAGLEAAVVQWNSLKSDCPQEYDFSGPQFYNLYSAMSLDRIPEAESIARLCARILPEPDLKIIEDDFSTYQNRVATVVLRAIREH
jgi:CubicO group peptidase (beta-lactamase class C family)